MTLPTGLGAVLAVVVLVLAIVFVAVGTLPLMPGALIATLAVARLT